MINVQSVYSSSALVGSLGLEVQIASIDNYVLFSKYFKLYSWLYKEIYSILLR